MYALLLYKISAEEYFGNRIFLLLKKKIFKEKFKLFIFEVQVRTFRIKNREMKLSFFNLLLKLQLVSLIIKSLKIFDGFV